ncbi:MAG TPA: amino acid permease [Candidatus Nitrosotalea sp.]|nr:amino acid permease [Candidatus Nitrosotalea sp.]
MKTDTTVSLRRELTVTNATVLVVSNTIGAGIFTTTGFLAGDLGRPWLVLTIWVAGAGIALAGCLSYAEMGINLPHSGGEYVYLREAWGPEWGFLSGWVSFFAGFSAPIAAGALGVSAYLGTLVPGLVPQASEAPIAGFLHLDSLRLVSVALIVALALVNIRGVRLAARLQNALTIITMVAITGFLALGLTAGHGDWAHLGMPTPRSSTHGLGSQFAVSLVFVMFAYSGWNAAAYVAEELRLPEKTLPRALLGGTGIVAMCYVALNVAYIYALPLEALKGVLPVGAMAAKALFGERVGTLSSGVLTLALLASVSAMSVVGPRIYYAMARDGCFPSSAARLDARWQTPVRAIVYQAILSCVLVLTGTFEALVYYIGFALILFAALAVAGLFRLRKRAGWRRLGAVDWCYPAIPAAFVIVSAWMLAWTLVDRPREAMWGILTVACGAAVYRWRFSPKRAALLVAALLISPCGEARAQSAAGRDFLTFEQAQPVLRTLKDKLPPELTADGPLTAAKWMNWVRKEDAGIRARLERGEEDTLTNLLRFGVTYTKEYRIDDEYLAKYGHSSLVGAFADTRANDLIRAMAGGRGNEGIAHMRAFLEKKGYSFRTPAERKRTKAYLLANLGRMRDEMLRYIEEVRQGKRSQLFEDRGISLDTNLWPDFLIDRHLMRMAEKGLLRRRAVHRVAIVGPGLDFANKEMGNDFYPRQTIQPFAVLDSLFRLGLADPASLEVYTLDISPEVNIHIERARKNAAAGRGYVVQLPWDTSARMTPEYRSAFIEYWQKFGASVGKNVQPIAVPDAAAAVTQTRAVEIRPEVAGRITALDANIIFQHPAPNGGFDLIIGTNIFIYFGELEQSLASRNMALMLNPGGFVLSNDKLPSSEADGLADSLQSSQVVARNPDRVEFMFTYVRRN